VTAGLRITREQVVARLREANYHFERRADRVEIYKNGVQRVGVPRRDQLPELSVRTILHQAGLTADQVERFLVACVK